MLIKYIVFNECVTLSDKEFDTWVHTGRNIVIKQCSPDSELARQKLENQNVSFHTVVVEFMYRTCG